MKGVILLIKAILLFCCSVNLVIAQEIDVTPKSISIPEVRVNGTELSANHIKKLYSYQLEKLKSRFDSISSSLQEHLIQEIILKLVDQSLIRKAAAEKNISVCTQELNNAYRNLMSSISGRQQKDEFIESVYEKEAEIKKELKTTLLLEKLAGINNIKPTTLEEAETYYNLHLLQYNTPGHFLIYEIIFSASTPDNISMDDLELKASQFLKEAKKDNVSFSLLARKYQMGNKNIEFKTNIIYKDSEKQKVLNSLSKLKKFGISAPIKMDDGIHVYQLISSSPEKSIPFSQVKNEILAKIRERRIAARKHETLMMLQSKANIEGIVLPSEQEFQGQSQISSDAFYSIPVDITIDKKAGIKSMSKKKIHYR